MAEYFVQLKLGNQTYKGKVSSEGCKHVADFKKAIKKEWANRLKDYDSSDLTLFQPDGKTEIDPETLVSELKEIPWHPMIVTVLELAAKGTVVELPSQAAKGSSNKQLTYKGMSVEASCRKYLDAVANELSGIYSFSKTYKKATMGDLISAKKGSEGVEWEYRKDFGKQLTTVPLPSVFTDEQWIILEQLNHKTNNRIHDAALPRTISQKPFVIIPHSDYNDNVVNNLKQIAAIADIVFEVDELVVKDESDLSGSPNSESGSPDKEKKM